MKVAFITPSVSRTAGGIFEIERRLAQTLNEMPGTEVEVYGVEDQHTQDDLQAWRPLNPLISPYIGLEAFRFSPLLMKSVLSMKADVSHLHALWMHTSVVLRKWSTKSRRPYVITLNGMLEPWAIRNAHWKKQLALTFFERGNLERAGCIQVNSEAEYNSARAFGLRGPICIIPNGVDLPNLTEPRYRTEPGPLTSIKNSGRKTLLYLGRIHPKKGLVNLLKGWSRFQRSVSPGAKEEWTLAIAGWDQGGHQRELKEAAAELGLSWSDVSSIEAPQRSEAPSHLYFLGPQFNLAKELCYRDCDGFILPSESEGLPMAALEAWSYGRPVLITPGCNLPEGYAAGAAMSIEPTEISIERGIAEFVELSREEQRSMGDRGLGLVKERFIWRRVAREMRSVYSWILGEGQRPSCVQL
jgi:glycosyltransferase involved in cell wall biosynthesis